MLTILRKLVFVTTLITAILSLTAQANERTFQIDVLVFSQDTNTTEDLSAPSPTFNWPNRLIRPGQQSTEKVNALSSSLLNAATTLKRKPQYSVLKHISWTQRIGADKTGRSVKIDSREIKGFVQLKRGHTLHLNIGMEYQNPYAENTFTISEQRRILLNQKHYFDHPRFGVIVSITPQ